MLIDSTYPKSFASDNHAGVHPDILAAMAAANDGDAPAYGGDRWTAAFEGSIKEVFGPDAEGFAVLNGAGANMVGLALMLGRYDAILCADGAHIATHEAGAAERLLGVKLMTIPTAQGKLQPGDIQARLGGVGNHHESQPAVVSISQCTELGTTYSPEEIAALAEAAHEAGLRLHVDGARLANAAAFLGCDLKAITTDLGVDVFSFGGTKNGALAAEAVVVLDPELTRAVPFLRRQSLQLASKMRFISAQLSALLTGDLWRRNADHANRMAMRLATGLEGIAGVSLAFPVQSNAVFASLPPAVAETLQQRYLFHFWDEASGVVRWMTAFDTAAEHVDDFLDDIRKAAM
ncbi:aminotransferase class V-fold PLP-dependent enzyme [Nonomuraea sp. KC401]|uniref:threonine aldolase family protein n=1 Tax=unclassified Nonomuraea TaxID=2593643 RepID=UPI0010FF19C6|nr:beta-eliminating lyase-related protein [Nonomuraea sp. KC401]NBE93140.1 aminotransferase class V-fold PLP-dependent enzyme [Nonomuraea sp. K271]TLF82876.1 aminotransferase class V-fold PLP-dependent enzyme [Nonomuraea sp. KC401]